MKRIDAIPGAVMGIGIAGYEQSSSNSNRRSPTKSVMNDGLLPEKPGEMHRFPWVEGKIDF
jgi:hypothetical protein